jgi:AraC-like DNA-binding protein
VSILKSLIKFEFAREVKKGSQLFLPLEMPIPDKIVTANMEAKGWTLAELSRELGISENTVTQRLHVKGIDPLFRGAIYPPDTLDRIREAPMGRPPKKTKP